MTAARTIPVCIRGRYLWRGDSRFFVRGVVYQLHWTHGILDPISDECLPQLEHDIPLFKELGVNTIFVYFIDNAKAHTKAMHLLEEAGIYVLTHVSAPSCVISRQSPYESYKPATIKSFFDTVDTMAVYPNTLGIAAASQVITDDASLSAAPVVKAVVRDLKRYMKLKSEIYQQRVLPICYDADRTDSRNKTILDYLSSGDVSNSIDFWTCKNYSSSIEDKSVAQALYDDLVLQFGDVDLPIFLSEYSSSARQPRLWHETTALYSPQTSQIFSGGCAYQFWQGANGFGLVETLKHDPDTRWASVQEAIARAKDEAKVVEKRENDQGLLLIFHDFTNYKTSLAATRGIESDWDRDALLPSRGNEEKRVDVVREPWPWEPNFHEPESCIDWQQTENLQQTEELQQVEELMSKSHI